ncbi:unnamed protein product [Pleuronectes platessa]|uniref:Uncharacterized protein n=1 Tax=Pleuronectes platessa TaxID=8262 RepID=A0A9N7V7N3_PLEPL|nr:unnamed protein product [Pleuronectes platessa]
MVPERCSSGYSLSQRYTQPSKSCSRRCCRVAYKAIKVRFKLRNIQAPLVNSGRPAKAAKSKVKLRTTRLCSQRRWLTPRPGQTLDGFPMINMLLRHPATRCMMQARILFGMAQRLPPLRALPSASPA